MDAVVVVIVQVVMDQPAEMFFIQRDDMVEDLAAATSDPAFGDTVLPGCLRARSLGCQTRRIQERDNIRIELRVAIQNDVAVRASLGKGLTQLLYDPLGSRMTGDVEVQDPSTRMLDDEEAVKQTERHCRHSEEVERNDHLAMVLKKREPALAWITAASNSSKITGHAPFRDDQAELLKFSVDLGGSPVRVLFRQPLDQDTDLGRDLWSTATRPGSPTPVETKPGAVPADDGLRLHDDEDVCPT